MLDRIRYLLSITRGVHTIRLNSADAILLMAAPDTKQAFASGESLESERYPAVLMLGKVLRIDGEIPRGAIELC